MASAEDGERDAAAGNLDREPAHGEGPEEPRDNPIWRQDHVTLRSVGIDVGSSGTQVNFTRLHLRRLGEELTSRYFVVDHDRLYQSPVVLTPYEDGTRIDAAALGTIIDAIYRDAAQHPDDVDTGVVILTGEALRRENAARIARIVADRGGEFVCASAGHHMEAALAAFGSGAARRSYETASRILNVDIGGGTTKLTLVARGQVVASAVLHVGGRLVVADDGHIVRLEQAGRWHARRAGHDWELGDRPEPAALDAVAETMARTVVDALDGPPLPPDVHAAHLTEPLPERAAVDGVRFSGGVAEYAYRRETREHGDLGRRLGEAIRRHADAGRLPGPLLPPGECIRATVVGASEHSVQLSGNTTYISDATALLPRRNVQVVRPALPVAGDIDPAAVESAVRDHLRRFDFAPGEGDVVLVLRWQGPPAYERMVELARGVAAALEACTHPNRPILLVLDGDIAHTLGSVLREDLGLANDLLILDGLQLSDFEYIDLGRVRQPSNTVPITIKSLVFGDHHDDTGATTPPPATGGTDATNR